RAAYRAAGMTTGEIEGIGRREFSGLRRLERSREMWPAHHEFNDRHNDATEVSDFDRIWKRQLTAPAGSSQCDRG
ncbi:MAG: hypothetical protein KDA66_07800, partial [Planctomycetaceae bacterium]|nr:hypothetical protein [Planctomycetaceae bacterium]